MLKSCNMMIMPGNNLSGICHYFAGLRPGKIGIINTPLSWKNPPFYMPWALDNGCFTRWEPDKFKHCLRRSRLSHAPLWVAVPDVVANAEETLRLWHKWCQRIDFPKAFVCQDGHEPQDVPKEAVCCFIGGSTDWKLNNAHKFKGVRKLLHIGRVTTLGRIGWARDIGADSVDGNGFFRGRGRQYNDFIRQFVGDSQCSLF